MTNTTEFDRVLSDLGTARIRAHELATASFLTAWDAAGITDQYAVVHTPGDDNESRTVTGVISFTLDEDTDRVIDTNEGTQISPPTGARHAAIGQALEYLPIEALWESAVATQTEDHKYGGWVHYIAIAALRAWEEANR